MPDLVRVEYHQTGKSKKTNEQGMREMQEKAFGARTAQYLLIKAPPASGKSRALMFIALDKLQNQGIKKVIVAVPEKAIGGVFWYHRTKKRWFFCGLESYSKIQPVYTGMGKKQSVSIPGISGKR